ncbi:MAG: hypothetical protein MJ105_06560 [Lachnospiraceae bacterium]|nr:hypothetical protein [Lachnospiraceae bacterium]
MKKKTIGLLLATTMISTVAGYFSSINSNAISEDYTYSCVETLYDDQDAEENTLTPAQRNAINMMNYVIVLTKEINSSDKGRVYLESVYSSLLNNIYPNAVDTNTQAQFVSILDTLEKYRMIDVKRERLTYIYEQTRAQAIKQAIPSPVALLSLTKSKSIIKAITSVVYMAVDSYASYSSATMQADLQYLKDGWNLDDEEAAALHESRKGAFTYTLDMVRNRNLPGELALTEATVDDFVEWKNKTNITSKIRWFESKKNTYEAFGPYWLELASCYYEDGNYEQCLSSIEEYEKVATRIFRKNFDYAKIIPMAIYSAKEEMKKVDYIDYASKYVPIMIANCADDDWLLRYYASQIYIDLYANTKDKSYLEKAYDLVYDNVNALVDEQRKLNETYKADIQTVDTPKGATKQAKKEIKEYNKYLKETRKIELPPLSEALYVNCDLLFSLAQELKINNKEKSNIDNILHENGEVLFLTKSIDDLFWFNNPNETLDVDSISMSFEKNGEMVIPAYLITAEFELSVSIIGASGTTICNDWEIKKVDRPKKSTYTQFEVVFNSATAKKYKYQNGDMIIITITPLKDNPNETIEIRYNAVEHKGFLGSKSIELERETN